jgi:hypothetical protein
MEPPVPTIGVDGKLHTNGPQVPFLCNQVIGIKSSRERDRARELQRDAGADVFDL